MNTIRTTVILPDELFQKAKLKAVLDKITLSEVLKNALENHLDDKKPKTVVAKKQNKRSWLGAFKIGISNVYDKRSDLYEDHLKRKMGN